MSVAKSLFAGKILEESLFPYPSLRDKDREVLLGCGEVDHRIRP